MIYTLHHSQLTTPTVQSIFLIDICFHHYTIYSLRVAGDPSVHVHWFFWVFILSTLSVPPPWPCSPCVWGILFFVAHLFMLTSSLPFYGISHLSDPYMKLVLKSHTGSSHLTPNSSFEWLLTPLASAVHLQIPYWNPYWKSNHIVLTETSSLNSWSSSSSSVFPKPSYCLPQTYILFVFSLLH